MAFIKNDENKNIATAFFKAGYVEAWGRGYKKVKEALESADLPLPKVENFCGGTLVTIMRPKENPYKDENVGKDNENVAKDVVKDVAKETNIELNERQLNIIDLMTIFPTITAAEIANKISGKELEMSGRGSFTTRTIQRDIAYLQNHDIIKREGGRKDGRWVVIKNTAE